ncbi:TPA: hypothetical protein RQK66_004560 [Vibrio vulnificus]|nr:hypothetical protein [Vibrio vulnificus]HDY8159965.1 hypothetical protein [Vibrio vulnificus]
MNLKVFVFLLAMSVSTLAFPQSNINTSEQLSNAEKLYGLSLYWSKVSENFVYFDQVPELDFDKTYKEYISRILLTKNDYEYYRELMRFNALLKDGHTNVYMPESLKLKYEDWPSIELTEVKKTAVVTGVDKQLVSKIPLGSILVSVDGQDLETHLRTQIMPYIASSTNHILWKNAVRYALKGTPNSKVTVTVKHPSGTLEDVILIRDSRSQDLDIVKLNIPHSNGKALDFKWLDNGIAYLSLNSFVDTIILDEFYSIYDNLKQAKGIIIDLRFNGGGNSGIGKEILSNFTNQNLQGSIWKTRKHISAYKAWGYDGYVDDNAWQKGEMSELIAKKDSIVVPTFVLIGRNTASAAEDFLVYADKLEHFTTIGGKTYGSTGQPLFFDLPGGGSFRVCSKRDSYPDGREFVGFGISPDLLVSQTPESMISEIDVVLSRAIQKLEKML